MLFRRLRCSFCRRSNKDVAKLVAGANGYICDSCAHEAVRIIETTPPVAASPDARPTGFQTHSADWSRTWHFAATTD
jgi:ATP-dependent protease Clp ATPase subunit